MGIFFSATEERVEITGAPLRQEIVRDHAPSSIEEDGNNDENFDRMVDRETQIENFELPDLTKYKKGQIKKFMNYIGNVKLELHRSPEEIEDIKSAVEETVFRFGKHFSNSQILSIYPVGSMAEGTKIVEPNEFDFIIDVGNQVRNDVKIKEIKSADDCTTFETIGPHVHLLRRRKWKQSEDDIKFADEEADTGDYDEQTAETDKNVRQTDFFDEQTEEADDIVRLTDFLSEEPVNDILYKRDRWRFEVSRPSGRLTYKKSDLSWHGPVVMMNLEWLPTSGASLEILVDIVFAVKWRFKKAFVSPDTSKYKHFYRCLNKRKESFLIQKFQHSESGCFRFTFTTAEVQLLKHEKPTHILCYKILQYFLYDENFNHFVCSYELKMSLFQHSENCKNEEDPLTCLTDIINQLKMVLLVCLKDPDTADPVETWFTYRYKGRNLQLLNHLHRSLQNLINVGKFYEENENDEECFNKLNATLVENDKLFFEEVEMQTKVINHHDGAIHSCCLACRRTYPCSSHDEEEENVKYIQSFLLPCSGTVEELESLRDRQPEEIQLFQYEPSNRFSDL